MNLGHHLSVRLQAFASYCITRAERIIIKKKRHTADRTREGM